MSHGHLVLTAIDVQFRVPALVHDPCLVLGYVLKFSFIAFGTFLDKTIQKKGIHKTHGISIDTQKK